VPRQHATPGARARVTVTLALVAAFLAAASACLLTSVPAGAAQASGSSSRSAAAVVIDSVSPQVAKPNSTVTVSGTVTNTSSSALPGVSVVLRSSAAALASRGDLAAYASGSLAADTAIGSPVVVTSSLAPGMTGHWKLSLSVRSIGIGQFGVYPLAVQAEQASGATVGIERTYLPYWPGSAAAGVSKPLRIAWIWPLINAPQQGICTALTSNSLAGSLAPGGRLSTMLEVGSQYASRADLTWAVDPGLLSSVSTMTHSYQVGASTSCAGGVTHHASTAAATWLAGVRTATGGQLFTTPYDDVDVAALTHQGLDTDLRTAFTLGRSTASSVLGPTYQSSSIAWPADGLADSSVLGNLAVNGVDTVVLASSEMPATGSVFTPDDAVTSTPTPAGTTMKVLLADSTLTSVLGSAPASSASSAGGAFAVSQRFLAETAMIEAEDPQAARSVVVAPPRTWDPSSALASDVLSDTTSTPWLSPDTLSGLAATATSSSQSQRQEPPDNQISSSELTGTYLKQVGALGARLRSYKSILAQPESQYLDRLDGGVAATESSAWRGSPAARNAGAAMLARVSGYVSNVEQKVQVINSGRATLVGSSGSLPVSIQNGLSHAIRVRLQATEPPNSRLKVVGYTPKGLITVGAGQIESVRVSVHSGGVGSTTVGLRLYGQDGRPLPNGPVSLTVQSTQFGSTLLIIIFAALGVLVLTAIARAIRRGLRDTPGDPGGDGPGGSGPDDGDDEAKRSPAMPAQADGDANVEAGNDATESRYPPEAPDDHARARDWARYA
jgi:Family of unknown function (DUF6049)